jgi:hypothetical protein
LKLGVNSGTITTRGFILKSQQKKLYLYVLVNITINWEMTPIQIHLKLEGYKLPTGEIVESCLTAAIREARLMSGRNKSTGLPDPENKFGYLGHWSGAMCYITILDQIGKCYRPKTKKEIMGLQAIERTLSYFTSLTSDEIKAIYALRNAFFHDFSLYNRNSLDGKLQHTFTVDNHPTNKVVKLPLKTWDGQMCSRNSENNTYINLKTLGDLVEEIYQKLILLESNNELALELVGGETELTDRYTFIHK